MTDKIISALTAAESFISGFEDDELQEGIPELLASIRAAMALESAAPALLDAAATALPYVENAEKDSAYKAGAVKANVRKIRRAIERAEGRTPPDFEDGMRLLITRAIVEWQYFDEDVSGADLVEWFGEWRRAAISLLGEWIPTEKN